MAEDLGVITDEVDAFRDRYNIPGMHVLQVDIDDPDFSLAEITPNSVCDTGTHDNDTTVGWFHGSGGDIRSAVEIRQTQKAALALTGGTPETIHLDMIRTAFASNAQIAIAPMQDYLGLGSEARFNTPGSPAGNWRWRVRTAQLNEQLVSSIGELIEHFGRVA